MSTQRIPERFLAYLADKPVKYQLLVLATVAGQLIREAAEDHQKARAAVDKLITHIERAVGLRL